MNKKTISILTIGLLLGSGAIGAYQAMAQNNSPTQVRTSIQQEAQNPSYKGSIAVNNIKYEGKSEWDESKALAGLAKITADQAKKVAEAKVRGIASTVKLDNENGSLVYEVKIGEQEVKVDAGNGSILKIEQNDNEKEGIESKNEKAGTENEKGGDIGKDGIDHQFEGQAEHAD